MKISPQRGYILLVALVVSAVIMAITTAVLYYLTSYVRTERVALAKTEGIAIAEAGIDKAVYELNKDPTYTGQAGIALGQGTITTSVTSLSGSSKRITATAYVPNSTSPIATRSVSAT